jgi:hypothetical protein
MQASNLLTDITGRYCYLYVTIFMVSAMAVEVPGLLFNEKAWAQTQASLLRVCAR